MKNSFAKTLRASLIVTFAILFQASAWAGYQVGPGLQPHPDYDYAPSMIRSGNIEKFWWCGNDQPNSGKFRDVIYYQSVDLSTLAWSAVYKVLTPSASGWDSVFTCDPSVVQGVFHDPANGQTYSYAMYYTGIDNGVGQGNRIGVAFSNDGINWVKYAANPVVYPQVYPTTAYGAGQPATYNRNGGSLLYLFHTDTSTSRGGRSWVRTTSDGIHFSTPTLITNSTNAGPRFIVNGDYGYDPGTNTFYGLFGDYSRSGDAAGYSIGIFQISATELLAGQGSWTLLGEVNTNLTGSYLNHTPGILRDGYGNVNAWLPVIELFFSKGVNLPSTWDLTWVIYNPKPNTLAFNRYYGSAYNDHWVTTGYIPSSYYLELTLAYLYMAPQPGTIPVYGCAIGSDHFISTDVNCEGQFPLGINGWLYSSPPQGIPTVALYRCNILSGKDHFVSTSPTCEGQVTEYRLGYARTQP